MEGDKSGLDPEDLNHVIGGWTAIETEPECDLIISRPISIKGRPHAGMAKGTG